MTERFEILFKKYREGTLNIHEELDFAEMISDTSSLKLDTYVREDWFSHLKETDVETKELNHVLHKIHHQIHLRQTKGNANKVRKLHEWFSRVAAILFLPLLIAGLYLGLKDIRQTDEISQLQIVSPPGARVEFELPDGTVGVLNGGSTLSYSSLFKKDRHVELDGEVYFDVAHDKSHPFTLKGNDNVIEVLGTKFTFSAYSDEPLTELVLEEGKVLFSSPKLKSNVEIEKGQRLIEKDGEVYRSNVETWKYTAWKDGKLVFRNDNMAELVRRISRWYNVDVEVEGEGLNEYTFRGVFEDDSLEDVLYLLNMTSPISYEIIERKVNSEGSFTRKKVIFSKTYK